MMVCAWRRADSISSTEPALTMSASTTRGGLTISFIGDVAGMMTKLSSERPNKFPCFSTTPTMRYGMPLTPTSLPSGSRCSNSRSARSQPITAIGSPARTSWAVNVRPAAQMEGIDPEDGVGESLRHVLVHPLPDRNHCDQEGDPDEHADQREAALELVGPEGAERETNGF